MTDIRFYHLQTQSVQQALPSLLSKALERGMRVVVRCRDAAEVERLNEHLWTFSAESFLPHGSEKDGHAADQPIWLTPNTENPNGAKVIFYTGPDAFDTALGFDLCCLILDGRDEQVLSAGRARWSALKAEGASLTYWQQSERGSWEQKA